MYCPFRAVTSCQLGLLLETSFRMTCMDHLDQAVPETLWNQLRQDHNRIWKQGMKRSNLTQKNTGDSLKVLGGLWLTLTYL